MQASQPKPQGGFFRKTGDWAYGVYLGNESNTSSLLRLTAESTATELLKSDNTVDLFIGRDQGNLKWGWNLLHSSNKQENSGDSNFRQGRICIGYQTWYDYGKYRSFCKFRTE